MSRICRITPLASKDIEAIADYLATQSNLMAAENFLNTLNSTLKRLAQFPELGRKRDRHNVIFRCVTCDGVIFADTNEAIIW